MYSVICVCVCILYVYICVCLSVSEMNDNNDTRDGKEKLGLYSHYSHEPLLTTITHKALTRPMKYYGVM